MWYAPARWVTWLYQQIDQRRGPVSLLGPSGDRTWWIKSDGRGMTVIELGNRWLSSQAVRPGTNDPQCATWLTSKGKIYFYIGRHRSPHRAMITHFFFLPFILLPGPSLLDRACRTRFSTTPSNASFSALASAFRMFQYCRTSPASSRA